VSEDETVVMVMVIVGIAVTITTSSWFRGIGAAILAAPVALTWIGCRTGWR
jgi:hypothetical protein